MEKLNQIENEKQKRLQLSLESELRAHEATKNELVRLKTFIKTQMTGISKITKDTEDFMNCELPDLEKLNIKQRDKRILIIL